VFDAVSEFVNENKDDKYKCYYFESNNDPGFHSIKKQLTENKNIEPITNLTGVKFLRLLAGAHAIVGNSSSGLREAGFLGVPAVNIGDRQRNRFKSGNVFDCNFNKIKETIYEAVEYNPKPSTLYGSGTSSFHIIGRILEWHRKKLKNNKSSSQEPQTDIS
jgi:UDP-N-acetylglucosamine 2-epimerase